MTNHRLAIVVLNWNGANDSIACIESLTRQRGVIPDIILVDNNSADDSLVQLERYISKNPRAAIHLIKNSTNSGFTGGNNTGFRYALNKGYKFIGTLNPDAVGDRDWVSHLMEEFKTSDDIGLVTGIMARSDHNTIDTTGELFSVWGVPGPRGRDKPLTEATKEPGFVFGSTGGGFIARASLISNIGYFDEKFFMYFEDVDFCFRAQLAGYKVRYTPLAVAYHKISASTNKVPGLAIRQTFKNLPMLFVKDVPLSLWPQILPRFTLTYTLIFGNAVLHGNGWPAFVGWLKSLGLIPHMWRERRRIQSARKVTDAYINSIILHDIPPEQTGLRKFRRLFTGRQ